MNIETELPDSNARTPQTNSPPNSPPKIKPDVAALERKTTIWTVLFLLLMAAVWGFTALAYFAPSYVTFAGG